MPDHEEAPGASGNGPLRKRAVLLTTDCGTEMDDQWALAHLALCPELDLRGVVTSHAPNIAPPAAETAARVANEVLDHLPLRQRPPVLAGSSVPLADQRTPRPNTGVDFILQQARDHTPQDRLAVLVTGPATDVGSALLIDPTIEDRIEVVGMAFDGWPEGHDGYNVRNDVPSWQVVLDSSAPVTVGDAVVTIRDLGMTRERARELFAGCGAPGDYLVDLLVRWLDAQGPLALLATRDPDLWPVWDEVVVAYLLGLTASEVYPRPALREGPTFVHKVEPDEANGTIRWIRHIDATRLWGDLRRRLLLALGAPEGASMGSTLAAPGPG